MQLRAIRYFLAVAETGSFSRSAELMHVAQPAISRQIQALEQELKQSLLLRTAKGAEMTAEGRILYDRIRPIVAEYDQVREDMLSLESRSRRRLRLGVPPTCAEDQGVELLNLIAEQMPDASVEMIEGLSRFLPDWLAQGQVDVILSLQERADSDLEFRLVEREELAFLAPRSHPLAQDGPIALYDLAEVPLILSTGFHQIVADFARDYGIPIRCQMQIDSVSATRRIARTRGLATILPLSSSRREAREHGMVVRPIRPAPLRSLFIGKPKGLHTTGLGAVIETYLRRRLEATSCEAG